MRAVRSFLFHAVSAALLSGCAAAVVPVVVGGVAARHTVRAGRAHAAQPVARAPIAPPAAAGAAANALPDPVPSPPPATVDRLPADLAQMRAEQVYQGGLPAPGRTVAVRSVPQATPEIVDAPAVGWAALGHYVAAHLAPVDSVLLSRAATPPARWLPCAGRPPAILAPAALVAAAASRARDRAWLDAMRTLKVTLVTFGGSAGMVAETDPTTVSVEDLSPTRSATDLPAMRAAVGARYCVVALAGQSPADFPNGYTPDTTPPALRDRWGAGWFLFAPR